MGVSALAGRKGILSVERGWLGSSEINRVHYDPEETSLPKIEKILKKTGTYIRTVEESQ